MQRRTTKQVDPRDFQVNDDARTRYTYFVTRTGAGFQWVLAGGNGEILCRSEEFLDKDACLKRLHTVQQCAATKHVIDETR